MIDFATQVLLVILGFALVFNPEILVENIHWGVAPTWSNLAIAVPVAMLAYTGVETVSNLAEEAREPGAKRAERLQARRRRRLRDLLHPAADRALGAAGGADRRRADDAPGAAAGGGRLRERPDPRASSTTSASREACSTALEIYVGVLAATILFIATNAGIIGASRITYSMASYRQLPEVFRRLHPRSRRRTSRSSSSPGIAPILILLPGDVNFVGTLYSLGATLSFTVAHALDRIWMRR